MTRAHLDAMIACYHSHVTSGPCTEGDDAKDAAKVTKAWFKQAEVARLFLHKACVKRGIMAPILRKGE